MRKNVKSRIGLALAAVAATVGLTLVGSIPAEAFNASSSGRCTWPGRSTFDLVGDSASAWYNWKAYSPTGWLLGTYSGRTWYTPWEDATVFVSSNDTYYYIVHWCR